MRYLILVGIFTKRQKRYNQNREDLHHHDEQTSSSESTSHLPLSSPEGSDTRHHMNDPLSWSHSSHAVADDIAIVKEAQETLGHHNYHIHNTYIYGESVCVCETFYIHHITISITTNCHRSMGGYHKAPQLPPKSPGSSRSANQSH